MSGGWLCAAILLVGATASAQVSFQKIADKDSPGMGWDDTVLFSEPAIHAGQVGFRAYGPNDGTYVGAGGPITTIADLSTTIPGSTDTSSASTAPPPSRRAAGSS
jgi:hypothetical protein